MTDARAEIWTVGHSSHPLHRFLELLAAAGVTAVADVRSAPYSRRFRHFSREPLRAALAEGGIAYVWLGDALGGRHGEAAGPAPEAVAAALDRLGAHGIDCGQSRSSPIFSAVISYSVCRKSCAASAVGNVGVISSI